MKNSPLVSVIMNCHNSSKYLKESIESVYSQTYKNWEIVFWDNKSTDNSYEIVKSFDEKIKYFYSEKYTNLGTARRNATLKANGEYLAFLDCDDYWRHNKLELQIKAFKNANSDVGMVYGRTEYFYMKNEKKVVFNKNKKIPEGIIFSKLLDGNFISFVSAIVSKEKFLEIGGFPEHLQHSTDYWIFLMISSKFKVKAIDEIIATYRIHDQSLSKSLNIIGIKEGLQVISKFNSYKNTDRAKNFMRARLALSYLINVKIGKALKLIISYRLLLPIFSIIFRRLLGNKLHF